MDHPAVSHCAALTAECARKSLELDKSLARWNRADIEMLSTSRDAIALSRNLLTDINERHPK
jgi:hypothetical protein